MSISKTTLIEFLKSPLYALCSIRFYFAVLFKLKGTGLLYLIFLSALVAIPATFKVNSIINNFKQMELPNLIAKIPPSYLNENGRLICKDEATSYKEIYTSDGLLAILYNVNDEKVDLVNGQKPIVQIASTSLKVTSITGQYNQLNYLDFFVPNSDFNPVEGARLAEAVIDLAKVFVYFFLLVWFFSVLVLNTLLLCVFAKLLFALVGRMNTNFVNTLRLCAYSTTIVAIFILAEFFVQIKLPFSYLMLAPLIYLTLFIKKFRSELNLKGVEDFVKAYAPEGTAVKNYQKPQSKADISEYVDGLDSTSNKLKEDKAADENEPIIKEKEEDLSKSNSSKDKTDDKSSIFYP